MQKILTTAILIATSATVAFSEPQPSAADLTVKDAIAVVLGKPVMAKEKDRLSELIFGPLLDQYAKENEIEPTDGEINQFLQKQEETARQSEIGFEKDKERLLKELKSESLSAEQRRNKQTELESTESILKNTREEKQEAKAVEKELRPMLRDMARRWVSQWKVNKALYTKYGGRVVFQQAGVEPLDAYRDFLREREKQGAFKIHDKAAADTFWKYFTDDSMHTFYRKDEGEKMMAKPFWLMDKPIGE